MTDEPDALRLLLRPNPRPRPRYKEIGGYHAYVLDGFFQHPEPVRALALSLDYAREPRHVSYFPGRRAIVRAPTEDLEGLLQSYVEKDLVLRRAYQNLWLFSAITANDLLSASLRIPHVDHSSVTGLVWLSLENKGGTGFYQHRETGLSALPNARNCDQVAQAVAATNEKSAEDLYRRILKPDGRPGLLTRSTRDWKLLGVLKARFNRAVLFPSMLFHSQYAQSDWYGNSLRRARLSQTFFLAPGET